MATSIEQDLIQLRKRKREAEELGRRKKAADAEFKQRQARIIQRIEARPVPEGANPLDYSMKTAGTLFSVVEKIRASVDDRREYIRWALENDESIAEFLARWTPRSESFTDIDCDVVFVDDFFHAITNTELVEYKEKSQPLDQLVRVAIDDGNPLPPGATFRPDNYISQRAS